MKNSVTYCCLLVNLATELSYLIHQVNTGISYGYLSALKVVKFSNGYGKMHWIIIALRMFNICAVSYVIWHYF